MALQWPSWAGKASIRLLLAERLRILTNQPIVDGNWVIWFPLIFRISSLCKLLIESGSLESWQLSTNNFTRCPFETIDPMSSGRFFNGLLDSLSEVSIGNELNTLRFDSSNRLSSALILVRVEIWLNDDGKVVIWLFPMFKVLRGLSLNTSMPPIDSIPLPYRERYRVLANAPLCSDWTSISIPPDLNSGFLCHRVSQPKNQILLLFNPMLKQL